MSRDIQVNNEMHSAIVDHYKGMNDALHKRDELAAIVIDLTNELTVAKRLNVEYKETIEKTKRERDHYMRYSFALTTRINAMQDIWSGMLDLPNHEAESQLPATLEKNDE